MRRLSALSILGILAVLALVMVVFTEGRIRAQLSGEGCVCSNCATSASGNFRCVNCSCSSRTQYPSPSCPQEWIWYCQGNRERCVMQEGIPICEEQTEAQTTYVPPSPEPCSTFWKFFCTLRGRQCRNDSCVWEEELPAEFCGDAIAAPSEQCDDGNTISGDGCSERCMSEQPYGYIDLNDRTNWGEVIEDQEGHCVYARDFGDGRRMVTDVHYIDPNHPC